jgi:hypothetical protein
LEGRRVMTEALALVAKERALAVVNCSGAAGVVMVMLWWRSGGGWR